MFGIYGHATLPTSGAIVRLNVGGHLYTTLKSTLNGYISIALMDILKNCDKDGNVFIDRDGRMFYYILGFLRTGELCLPEDFSDFDSLTKEVIYFDIPELTSSLKRAKQKKLLPLPVFKYIEILETKIDGSVKTVLKGRKEDLESLPLTAFQIGKRQKNFQELPSPTLQELLHRLQCEAKTLTTVEHHIKQETSK